jgi:hypothetical protein
MAKVEIVNTPIGVSVAENRLLRTNPYLQLSTLELPKTIQQALPLIEGFLMSFPLIGESFRKMSFYPITELIYDSNNEGDRLLWKNILENILNCPELLIDINYNYFIYGNTFISVSSPMTKIITCPSCGKLIDLQSPGLKIAIERGEIVITKCPGCGIKLTSKSAKIKELPKKDLNQLNLILWNPKCIIIEYSPFTGQSEYWFKPTKEDTLLYGSGTRKTQTFQKQLIETPLALMEAVAKGQAAHIPKRKMLHMKSPSLAGWDRGWGVPRLLFCLKHLYYLQLMSRAQEAIFREHLVPMRYMYIQGQSQGIAGIVELPLNKIMDKLEGQINKWKQDPNHISLMPLPIGQGEFSGRGKVLSLTNELLEWSKMIISSLGIPIEFVMGGLSWSGSSVSLRMLENDFITIRNYDEKVLNYIIEQVRDLYPYLPPMRVRLSEFKMADDQNRTHKIIELASSGYVSWDTALKGLNIDFEAETKKRIEENEKIINKLLGSKAVLDVLLQGISQEKQIELQGVLQRLQAQSAQPQQPQATQEQNSSQVGPNSYADSQQQQEDQGQSVNSAKTQRELPEQKPPRRGPDKGQV